MPALADDNLTKWQYDFHTAIKHQILTRYLSPWMDILGSKRTSLAYVDGFAGRGKYVSGEPGSPVLVLDEMVRRANKSLSQEFSCFFVEENKQNYRNLEAVLATHPARQYSRITCRFYNTTFSEASAEIIDNIRASGQPSFFFVDPFGYDDPTMATLRRVLALPRAEVLVNLMFNFAHRAMSIGGNKNLHDVLDRLFGCGDWRPFADLAGEEREQGFAGLYRDQLRRNGAEHVMRFRMGDDKINRTLYYLVHGTKHPKGGTLMKEVMVALASPGELGYAGETRHISTPLFDLQQQDLPTYLHERYMGQTISFNNLLVETLEDDATATSREKNYRAAIYELEGRGAVRLTRVTTKHGLAADDEITFLFHRQTSLF